MADKIKVSIAGQPDVTDEAYGSTEKKCGVTHVRLERNGRTLILFMDPAHSTVQRIEGGEFTKPGELYVRGSINCFFIDSPVDVEVRVRLEGPGRGALEKLSIGRVVTHLWQNWQSDQEKMNFAARSPGSESEMKKRFGDVKLENPRVNLYLKPFRMQGSESDPVLITPVFESRATLGKKSKGFGVESRLGGIVPVQLIQIPHPFTEEVKADEHIWFAGIRGLPYSWGRSIWHEHLGDSIGFSALDRQHSSMFSPWLPKEGSDFQWDAAFKIREDFSALRSTLSRPEVDSCKAVKKASLVQRHVAFHALRLSSRMARGKDALPVSFPLLQNHEGGSLQAMLPLVRTLSQDTSLKATGDYEQILQSLGELIQHPGISFNFEQGRAIAAAGEGRDRTVRMGALDITFAENADGREGATSKAHWKIDLSRFTELAGTFQASETLIDLDWAVESISPGGQDDLSGAAYVDCEGDLLGALPRCGLEAEHQSKESDAERQLECTVRRERPLIVPLTSPRIPGLMLNVRERARLRDARRVDLELRRTDGEGRLSSSDSTRKNFLAVCSTEAERKQDRVVILDREPFLVAKVSYPSLGSLKDDAESTLFATWRSDGPDAGAWHIRFPDAQDFCLTLPPQAVGETMEKHLTLPDNQHADFRLSPPAILSMRELYYRQSFPEAPWNLRRLLSDPSREFPGAHVEHLQYELLYGLSCRVDHPSMRLVELSALIGNVVGPLRPRPHWAPRYTKGAEQGLPTEEARKAYGTARSRWAKHTKEVHQRLGVFELWDLSRQDTLELKEKVTCWIRQRPLKDAKDPQSRVAVDPFPSEELVRVPPADLGDPFKRPGEQDDKLAGGVTWGFESRNVYNAVMRPPREETWPRSNGAEIKDIRFSALGGYGHQMAAFDFWRTKILADVAMGRTYSYTLERIGRIAVWWNRAKHVIVYERTVVRSRQFGVPELNGTTDQQHPLEGRAVVRKVAEYIEILQNVRKYPDSEKGTSRATGFVTECSFSDDRNQVVRFRVRSSWGADIGTEGWKVPIWRPGEEPSDLYPKPVVNLTVMASVEDKSDPRKVTIADPDNLFFYTDTRAPAGAREGQTDDLSNTDAWEPVEGVDYVDEARPEAAQDPAFATGLLQQTSAGDTVIASGFRPCTFLIDPAEHTVDLLAHRQDNRDNQGDQDNQGKKPMGAPLSSVTLCRTLFGESSEGLGKKYRDVLKDVQAAGADWLKKLPLQGRIPDGVDLTEGLADLCKRVSEGATKIDQDLKKVQNAPADIVQLATDQAVAAIGSALDSLVGKAEQSELGRSLLTSLSMVQAAPGDKKELLRREIEREVGSIGNRVEAFLPSPTVLTDSVLATLQPARELLADVKKKSGELRQKIKEGLVSEQRLTELEISSHEYIERTDQALGRMQHLTETGARVQIGSGDAARSVPFIHGAQKALDKVRSKLEGMDTKLGQARQALAILRAWRGRYDQMEENVKRQVIAFLDEATSWIDRTEAFEELEKDIRALQEISREVEALKATWTQHLSDALVGTITDDLVKSLPRWPDAWTTFLSKAKSDLRNSFLEQARDIKEKQKDWFMPPVQVEEKAGTLCAGLTQQFEDFLKSVGNEAAAVRLFLTERRDEVLRDLDKTFGDEIRSARKLLGEVESRRDDVLKLARAFGKPPDVSGLKFDRPEVAFFYDELKDRVNVTPVIARAAQAAAIVDALKPFGVDLPVKELGEKLIPASLKNFDLSSILPNIAGIPLKNLFSGIKMPDLDDSVKIRHGVDKKTHRAWVNADVDFALSGNKTLFAVGPLAVRINEPQFKAEAKMDVDLGGKTQRSVKGRLSGNWQLQIGSFDLITFQETPLTFDEAGRVSFDVDPAKVQMAPALTFINKLLAEVSPSGVTTRFDGDGVVSTLDLPIPDTQLGAFGFSGLNLGASLALRAGKEEGFNIGVTAALGRKDAPFTLTIFILGGAGYIELGSRYFPSTGRVEAVADLAIAASASLAIALGPIRGGVSIYVGVTAQYDSKRGGGLTVGLLFMIRGHVSVLSIASATITLRLDAQYQGGALVGRGHLEIKIKICWCFTLKVSESVTYTLGRVGSSQSAWLGGPQPVAQIAQVGGLPEGGEAPPRQGFDPDLLAERIDHYFKMLV